MIEIMVEMMVEGYGHLSPNNMGERDSGSLPCYLNL